MLTRKTFMNPQDKAQARKMQIDMLYEIFMGIGAWVPVIRTSFLNPELYR